MKKLMLAVATISAGLPATAQTAVSTLTVRGSGDWEMICHVAGGSDDETVVLSPRRPSFSGFARLSCDQTGGSRGPLEVSVAGPAACPFKVAKGAACQQSFASGRSGSFIVR